MVTSLTLALALAHAAHPALSAHRSGTKSRQLPLTAPATTPFLVKSSSTEISFFSCLGFLAAQKDRPIGKKEMIQRSKR